MTDVPVTLCRNVSCINRVSVEVIKVNLTALFTVVHKNCYVREYIEWRPVRGVGTGEVEGGWDSAFRGHTYNYIRKHTPTERQSTHRKIFNKEITDNHDVSSLHHKLLQVLRRISGPHYYETCHILTYLTINTYIYNIFQEYQIIFNSIFM